MLKKLKLGSSVAALLLFFLPWIDIQCSEKSLITQSGVQSMYGGFSPSDDIKAMGGNDAPSDEDKPAVAILVIIAFVALLMSIFYFTRSLLDKDSAKSSKRGGILAMLALVMLVIQLIFGFPISNEMEDSFAKKDKDSSASSQQEKQLTSMMEAAIQAKFTFGFYVVLILLAVPSGLMVKEAMDAEKETK